MSFDHLTQFPTFLQELAGTLAVHSQYVMHGNIRDRFLLPEAVARETGVRHDLLLELVWQALRPIGYECLIVSDQVDGVAVYPRDQAALQAAHRLIGKRPIGRKATLERLRTVMARVVGTPDPLPFDGDAVQRDSDTEAREQSAVRAAFVIDFASRLARVPGSLDETERDFFLFSQKLALTAEPQKDSAGGNLLLFNPVIWLTEGDRDLPAWLTVGVERIRSIAVPRPGLEERRQAARLFSRQIVQRAIEPSDQPHIDEYANRTDDMTLHAMREIARLASTRGLGLDRIVDAIRIYKLGVEDNPWRRDSVRKQLRSGEEVICKHVRGQEAAVTRTLDILKRAALGLSGAQATSSSSRPRGTLFFAGPTGVGKTELAKRVAAVLFGDQEAYLRFDMSEFSANHAADRLTGAPPGYVGYEAGGELTGAVRRKPFQVILFDEIEKAHSQILDKFLQILEDGRLTDGQGVTTHFSECVLIFTSNLGIVHTDKKTGERTPIVGPETPYPEVVQKVKAAIREHFTFEIGRPELLNRLGDNIVVFDFIREKTVAEILDLQLENVRSRLLREHEIALELGPDAVAGLLAACVQDRGFGGRGVGNQLESRLINPLARFLFDNDCPAGSRIRVDEVTIHNGVSGIAARQLA